MAAITRPSKGLLVVGLIFLSCGLCRCGGAIYTWNVQSEQETIGAQNAAPAICADATNKVLQPGAYWITIKLQPNCWSGAVSGDSISVSMANSSGQSLISTNTAPNYTDNPPYSVYCSNNTIYADRRGLGEWYLNRGCPPPYRFKGNAALDVWLTRFGRR